MEDKSTLKYWKKQFNLAYNESINTWAYRWTLACWIQNGLTIIPNVNLVSNIGFNSDATHTKVRNKLASMVTKAISFPLQHPRFIIRDTQADNFTHIHVFKKFFFTRIRRRFSLILERAEKIHIIWAIVSTFKSHLFRKFIV